MDEGKEERAGGWGAGELPVSAAISMPIPGADLGVKASTSKSNVKEQKFESKEPLIFAVAYDVVMLKKSFDKTVPGYFKDKIVLGPARRANPKNLMLAGEDDEDTDEEGALEDDIELVGGLNLEDIEEEGRGLSFEME